METHTTTLKRNRLTADAAQFLAALAATDEARARIIAALTDGADS